MTSLLQAPATGCHGFVTSVCRSEWNPDDPATESGLQFHARLADHCGGVNAPRVFAVQRAFNNKIQL